MEIKLDNKLTLVTNSTSLGDWGDNTLINPDSILFKTAMYFSKGDKIKFNGSFFSRSGKKSTCLRHTNFTLKSRINKPEYLFKFTKVEKVK